MLTLIKKYNFLLVPKVLGYFGFFIMSSIICYAIVYGDFFAEGSVLTSMPWGIVSLVDIYLGLILFSLWVFWRESNTRHGLLWAFLILALGNVVSCLYLIKAATDAEGNVVSFWIGKERAEGRYVV
jgi:hypothetical protein